MGTTFKVVGHGGSTLITEDELIEHVILHRHSDGHEYTYFELVPGRFLFWTFERWVEIDPLMTMLVRITKGRMHV